MLELADRILPALRRGEQVAVVTVSRVARSAPRGPGAAMAVLRDGSVIGSISGGCVEGDAVLLASDVLVRGGVRTASLGFSDDAAHAAGLACGGSVDVVVHRVEPTDASAIAALEEAAAGRFAAVDVRIDGEGAGRIDAVSDRRTNTNMRQEAYGVGRVFRVVHFPRPRLVIVGAGEHAAALTRLASASGFDVAVCDVWERLVTRERFPTAAVLTTGDPAALLPQLIEDAATTAVCVLTHDERIDVPAIAAALALDASFVGAMGARATVSHRRRLLAEAGVDPEHVDRLHSPLGLDLGGTSVEETALSVLAEIVAARHGGSGRALRDTGGALHPRRNEPEPNAAPSCSLAGSIR
jgi:xanthine dehydrogenase accessory factor